MATSYIANLKIPTGTSFNNGGYANFQQTLNGGGTGYNNINQILGTLRDDVYELNYGGSMTWTSQTVAGFEEYTFTFTGLTTDPTTDATNGYDIVMFAVRDENDLYYAASWLSTQVCEENDLCRPYVNPEDATDCLSCYQQTISTCPDEIVIEGLDTDTDYVFTVTDNVSGKKYTYTVTSDGFGDGTIDTTAFPAGLFTPYNSPMTLTITENGSPVTLTYGYVNYSCIELVINNDEAL